MPASSWLASSVTFVPDRAVTFTTSACPPFWRIWRTLADFDLKFFGELAAVEFSHHFRAAHTVGFGGRNVHRDRLTGTHPGDRLFKTGNQLAFANRKLEHGLTRRGVKDRAVIEFSSVVNAYRIAPVFARAILSPSEGMKKLLEAEAGFQEPHLF